jgi:hypothetical protein
LGDFAFPARLAGRIDAAARQRVIDLSSQRVTAAFAPRDNSTLTPDGLAVARPSRHRHSTSAPRL